MFVDIVYVQKPFPELFYTSGFSYLQKGEMVMVPTEEGKSTGVVMASMTVELTDRNIEFMQAVFKNSFPIKPIIGTLKLNDCTYANPITDERFVGIETIKEKLKGNDDE